MKLIHLSDLHLGKRVNEVSMIEDQEYKPHQCFYIKGGLSSQMQHFFESNFIGSFPAETLSGTKV